MGLINRARVWVHYVLTRVLSHDGSKISLAQVVHEQVVSQLMAENQELVDQVEAFHVETMKAAIGRANHL